MSIASEQNTNFLQNIIKIKCSWTDDKNTEHTMREMKLKNIYKWSAGFFKENPLLALIGAIRIADQTFQHRLQNII